ncbi:branched-chain amino acid ABC transporter permease [Spongisporangium articulatum]|uniref:Branched-chain amino acid ABC transporter permease n=1 Tax=Spongisporangium articulatum TaxID=3362603 RepID=A0ABW8ARD9_9ACTN
MTTTTDTTNGNGPGSGSGSGSGNGASSAGPVGWLRERAWPIGFLIAALLIFSLYQWVVPNSSPEFKDFIRGWFNQAAINECIIWVIFALGLNIVVGYAGLLDLGYVAFWALGGYFAGWVMSPFFNQVKINFLGNPWPGQERGIHLSFWLVLPLAGLFCALWGVLIGAPTLRLKGDYLAIVTLGFGEIIPQIFMNAEDIKGFNLSNGVKGISPVDRITLGPLSNIPNVPEQLGPFNLNAKFVIFCLLAAFCMFVSLRIREGRLGRAWLAIREDELAASMMGVPLMRTKLAAYAVGASAGGIGGVAYAEHVNGVLPDTFKFSASITLLAMVVLGGMGNVWGVTLGAVLIAWINNTGLAQFGDTVNSTLGTNINFPAQNFLLFGLILVLMMLFRREGLLPEARTRQVLQEPERGEVEAVGADLEGDPV